ncbi:MAG: T9SS type A sorting domain-containing protein [Ignavibacteria bacterium]|nr:T9SS type A sorting domain-containing protein [Ignavibacteria bacterium]
MKTKLVLLAIAFILNTGQSIPQSAWVQQYSNVTANLYAIHFIDSLTGWVCGNNVFLKTTNGGDNWTPVAGFPAGNNIYMKFFSNTSAIIYGSAYIYKTYNAWNSWTGFQTQGFSYLSFPDTINGWGAHSMALSKTTNGGLNWSTVYSALNSETIKGVAFITPLSGFLGIQQYISPPYTGRFYIWGTNNGGISWGTSLMVNNAPVLSTLTFYDNNRGVVCGEYTSAYATFFTSNCGASWIEPVPQPTTKISCLATAGANDIWLAGLSLLYSSNSGANFTFYPGIAYPDYINSITFVSHLRGWMAGNNGKIYRTTTGPNPVPLAPLQSMPGNGDTGVFINPRFIWSPSATAASYRVQISSDTLFSNIVTDSGGIQLLYFDLPPGRLGHNTKYFWRINAANNFGSGSWSGIWRFTTSKFANPPILLNPPFNSNEISLTPVLKWRKTDTTISQYHAQVSLNTGFTNLVLDSAGIIKDSLAIPPGRLDYNTLYFWRVRALNFNGWGPYSAKWIFRTIVSGLEFISSEIPAEFKLYQNYPNPFNPSTKVKFDVPALYVVKLVVYNLLGRIVAELVNGKLNPGTYEVEWNAGDNPSGVYFYRLSTGTYTETKRLLFVK